ncbi:hypothetical protein F2Q69_00012729 [Brassica cretica]|uniref:Replication protein A 70 kDa DNA-binding subunit B/D first OB fold domain-containing protein n=1 Tax=Brassica cretica TaxID=69181 RepID=A0A8S9R1Y7_BRACR|nr:hypothetical protein F2Q69_00012729 [Brassica cretica]
MKIPRNISSELPRIGPSENPSKYPEEALPRYIPRSFPTNMWSSEFPRKFVSSEFRRKIPRDFRGKMNFRGVIFEDLFRRQKLTILFHSTTMAAITNVCDLKPFKSTWKIRVKILRLWKQYSATGGLTIEMVLIDSNGVKINASVKKDLVNQFDSFLSQGSSKILINFSLNPSCGSYRTTIHPYKIGFLSTTRVRCCDALPDELTGFEPVNYRDILDGSLNTDYLVDVIGQIVEVTPIEVVSANGKETKKITVELRNEKDERLPLVLWGNFATDVNEAIERGGDNAVVCVLRFGKIKVWKDERSVSNAYNVSDVELNPFMPEVEAFLSLSVSLPKDELLLAVVQPKPLALTNGVG